MTERNEWDRVGKVVYAESEEQSDKAYSTWAQDYDKDLKALKFVANDSMVQHSFDLIKNDESSLMLDVAAGSGLTALAFRHAGYKGICDAIEINAAMLEIAKQKGIYRNSICQAVTGTDPLPVQQNSYDFAAISGAFLENHLPQGCVPHIVDALKIGGLMIFNSRNTEQNAKYQKVLWDILESQVEQGRISLVRSVEAPYYNEQSRESGKPMTARYSVYKRMK